MSAAENLKRALRKRDAAEREIARVLREQFPVGVFVAFAGNNGNTLLGRVTDHAHGDRIKIENAKTGRAYWVHAWRLQ